MKIIDLKEDPEALHTLGEWHHKEWSYLNPNTSVQVRIEKMKSHLGEGLIPSTFIAKDDVLIGSAAIVAHDMDAKPQLTPWLASVFVAPEHRGKGVGSELVRYVMRKAQEAGIGTLYLFTPDREGFYKNLGWQVLSKETYRGHLVTIMQVRLNDR